MSSKLETAEPTGNQQALSGVTKKLAKTGPRKLLAIDGGGVRGGICLGVLEEIQRVLREMSGNPSLVLADYFDYVAGTSVGAILAAGVSVGMSVEQMREYTARGVADFFRSTSYWNRLWFKYTSAGLLEQLRELFGDITLGSPRLQTLLMMVMRNATTDSPWPVSNNPRAKFNDCSLGDCNLHLPLWQLVRASAAAPTFFPPEEISLGGSRFCFVDGAASTANNPAYQLFLQATLPPYHLCWPTGTDQMLLISIGTGRIPTPNVAKANMLHNATGLINMLLTSAAIEQDLLCRVLGKCIVGDPIDSEIGDLIEDAVPWPKQFTYCRYDVELSARGFEWISSPVQPERLHTIDDIRVFDEMLQVGHAVAKAKVRREHFKGFEPSADGGVFRRTA